MTPQERQLLEEAEEAAVQSAQEFADAQMTSGIRPPPTIDETETVLEPQLFGFEFSQQPAAESEPGASAPVPPVSVTCPPANPCTLDFDVSVPNPNGWSTSQTGLDMYIGDCQFTSGTGWHANHWAADCVDVDCFNNDNSVCNDLPESCKCGWYGRWKDASLGQVQIKLAFIQGDDLVTPDGWWLLIGVINTTGTCFWGGCQSAISYYGEWLGSDDSIFATDLVLPISLPADTFNPEACSTDPISFNITFHPC